MQNRSQKYGQIFKVKHRVRYERRGKQSKHINCLPIVVYYGKMVLLNLIVVTIAVYSIALL